MTLAERVSRWSVAAMLMVLAVLLALQPLMLPAFTQTLVERFSSNEETGLSDAEAAAIAEQVRAFVVEGTGSLPERVGSRAGFDTRAIEHLVDVREVMSAARLATGGLTLLAVVWLTFGLARRRLRQMTRTLRAAARMAIGFPLVVMLVGLLAFDAVFAGFHALFFSAGTWVFPYDSLLIQLFPEPFWALAAVSWGVFVVVFGLLFGLASVSLGRLVSTPPTESASGM